MPPRPSAVLRSIATSLRPIATTTPQPLVRLAPSKTTAYQHVRAASSSSSSSSSKFGIRAPPPPTNPLTLRDAQIPYETVQLVDPSSNALLAPQPLKSILSTYSTSTHNLVLVNVDREYPIVKLLEKEVERKKEKVQEDKARVKRLVGMEEKEVQVSWQSAQGDLTHKLSLAKGLLGKGDRVQVVFANRKRGEAVSENRKEEIVKGFDETLGEIGKKWKDDERTKGLWVLYYNPLESVRNEVAKKVVETDAAKKKEKEEKKEARRKKEEERRAKAEARAAAAAAPSS
ncbi:hypothetical protein CI109_104478 [Kwoniella shandongensis]|uniref:Uncharacterized protein n=1 Tax=Kwoniella shandongensis TaxID=1734106 RepID=A0A5M6BRW8_9TREE|nr:uncharacterized protein CI109_006821 [Kwoniella shandongensis]KAA5524871.1 hypothetical protein CI109_006821 [Kwoniella shandongensis]